MPRRPIKNRSHRTPSGSILGPSWEPKSTKDRSKNRSIEPHLGPGRSLGGQGRCPKGLMWISGSALQARILSSNMEAFWEPKWIKNRIGNRTDFCFDFGSLFEAKGGPERRPKWSQIGD